MSALGARKARRRSRVWMRRLGERRATTAVVFALTITPILGFVALAFDVGSTVWARAQLDLAADAAALTAATKGANDYAADPNTSLQPAQDAGVKRFNAQAGHMPGVIPTSLSVSVTRDGGTVTAVVNYTAQYTTQFAGLFGFPTLPASGTAAVSRTTSPYFAIDILMDDSSSMAIAATPADMLRLGTLVRQSPWFNSWGQSQNCAFGCHFDSQNNDFYGLAKSNGVPLRIDVLNQAVTSVLNTVSTAPTAAQFEVGLYSFNAAFNTVYPSGDPAGAAAALQNMQVPVTTLGNDADTNIPLALQSITALTPAAGDGSSQGAPRRFLFIITDGVADYNDPRNGRVIAPLDPAQCSALKAKGVQILTLYTDYVPLVPPNVQTPNSFYQTYVDPFVGTLKPNLSACASSPAFAFEASDPASIQAALQAMVQAALSAPARFTQ